MVGLSAANDQSIFSKKYYFLSGSVIEKLQKVLQRMKCTYQGRPQRMQQSKTSDSQRLQKKNEKIIFLKIKFICNF